jgi:hypothetical protein
VLHVAWEHSSLKNVDLVPIQSVDPQTRIFNTLWGDVVHVLHVALEHSSLKNVDLVPIQSVDPQTRIFNTPIFDKVGYFTGGLDFRKKNNFGV